MQNKKKLYNILWAGPSKKGAYDLRANVYDEIYDVQIGNV